VIDDLEHDGNPDVCSWVRDVAAARGFRFWRVYP
jgi:hypothetical protein